MPTVQVCIPYMRDDKLLPPFSYLCKSCLSFSIWGMIKYYLLFLIFKICLSFSIWGTINYYLPFLIFVRVVFLYMRDDKLLPPFSYLCKSCLSFSIWGMINYYLPFYLNWPKARWAFAITWRLSYVVNIFKNLLLWTYLTNWNQTWSESPLGCTNQHGHCY